MELTKYVGEDVDLASIKFVTAGDWELEVQYYFSNI